MTLRRSFSRCGRIAVTVAFLAVETFVASIALAAPKLEANLHAGRDYQGQVQGIAFDRSGTAWIATGQTLYRVRSGKAEVVDVAAGRGDRLAVAPGGDIYARLATRGVPGGLFTVELLRLVRLPREPIAVLRLPEFPFGFGKLYLGGAGKLIVTATPLDDAEGLGGNFLYVFWSREGEALAKATLKGLRTGIVDAAGTALLLLGEDDAIAFSSRGKRLWKLDGRFRNGILSSNGEVALLNPAATDSLDEVHVRQRGKATIVTVRSPVYELAVAADGSTGAVAVDNGGLFFVTPSLCDQSCEFREAPPLPVDGTFFVSAIRFADSDTLAVGVIQRQGEEPAVSFPAGATLVVSTAGEVLFRSRIEVGQPATWGPSIDVSYDTGYFAAHTPQTVLLISLGR
jgi:hypothetical protein